MDRFPIIDKLGGREVVFTKLKARGYKIKSTDTIRMWSPRGNIPGDATRHLMAEADDNEIEYTAKDFEPVETAAA